MELSGSGKCEGVSGLVANNHLLVDTDILIDALRNRSDAIQFLSQVAGKNRLRISVISQMEITIGCRNNNELSKASHFMARFTVVSLSEMIGKTAVSLLERYRMSHGLLIPDALIAATSLTEGYPLVTRNRKDFRYIEDLVLTDAK